MALIKDVYSVSFYERFLDVAATVIPSLDKKAFIKKVFDEDFKQKEWKDRMRHTTKVLHEFMPPDFSKAAKLIDDLIARLKNKKFDEYGIAFMF